MTSDREKFVEALLNEVFDNCGWLSDAQNAELEAGWYDQTVYFRGEGWIDVAHIASIAEQIWGRK